MIQLLEMTCCQDPIWRKIREFPAMPGTACMTPDAVHRTHSWLAQFEAVETIFEGIL